jgi:hypothetical protein
MNIGVIGMIGIWSIVGPLLIFGLYLVHKMKQDIKSHHAA